MQFAIPSQYTMSAHRGTRIASACLVAAALTSSIAQAQNYPVKPVSIVVPFGPGASSDIETRLYAHHLSQAFGSSFVVDYKPGAGGSTGAAYVAKAPPDGYTMLATSGSLTATAAMNPDLPFDPIKDFSPLSLMSQRTTVLAVHPSVPIANVQEYIAYSRANPEKLRMGTPGVGSSPHLNGAWLHSLMNTKVTFVHYKSTALNLTDLLAGRTEVFLGTGLSALPHLKTGKLKLLAVANGRRSPMLPGALTISEQGVAGYDYSSMFGIITTGGVPAPIVDRVGAELGKIAAIPDVIKRIEADGGFMVGSTPAQFRQIIASEVTRYRKIVQEANIQSPD